MWCPQTLPDRHSLWRHLIPFLSWVWARNVMPQAVFLLILGRYISFSCDSDGGNHKKETVLFLHTCSLSHMEQKGSPSLSNHWHLCLHNFFCVSKYEGEDKIYLGTFQSTFQSSDMLRSKNRKKEESGYALYALHLYAFLAMASAIQRAQKWQWKTRDLPQKYARGSSRGLEDSPPSSAQTFRKNQLEQPFIIHRPVWKDKETLIFLMHLSMFRNHCPLGIIFRNRWRGTPKTSEYLYYLCNSLQSLCIGPLVIPIWLKEMLATKQRLKKSKLFIGEVFDSFYFRDW